MQIKILKTFYSVFSGINPNEEEMKDIINEVDMDGSGKIEWPEFAATLAEKLKPDEDDEVSFKETFRVFSKDQNGCITADEMKFVLSQVLSSDCTILFVISLIRFAAWRRLSK